MCFFVKPELGAFPRGLAYESAAFLESSEEIAECPCKRRTASPGIPAISELRSSGVSKDGSSIGRI